MIGYMLNKIATLQFWWVDKTLKYDRDFRYSLEDDDVDSFTVEVLRGKFKDVKIRYGRISVREDKYGHGMIDVESEVILNPRNVKVKCKQFDRLCSNIVRLILIESIKVATNNETRDVDFVEFDEERGVREEDSAIHQDRVSPRKSRKKNVSGDQGSHSQVQRTTKRRSRKADSEGTEGSN